MAKEFTYKAQEMERQVNALVSKLETLRKSLTNVMESKANPKIERSLDSLEHRLSSLLTKAKTPIHSVSAFSTMERDISSIDTAMKEFGKELDRISKKTDREKVAFTTGEDNKRLTKIISLMDRVEQLRTNQAKNATALEEALTRQKDLSEAIAEATKRRDQLGNKESKTSQEIEEYKTLGREIERYRGSLATTKSNINELTTAQGRYKESLSSLKLEAKSAGISLEHIGSNVTDNNLDKLISRLSELVTQGLAPFIAELNAANTAQEQFRQGLDTTSDSLEKDKKAFIDSDTAAGQVDGITNRIKQFTGLTGVALVMRRALNGAIQTTKELDKQMTAMAVVTNLEVGDYWKQLPEHTARANALGVAIKDVYEAETLYYQQGLKTAEVTALATQTLKMARIAGLSAEEATNKMTAALRGFNMEITEANAQNIADVYSKLAAITASDVEEISTAMTKTASLASNAGMQFETTAAFLAQIIETTRESAETAGTALKTVIARFQELKKSPDEIGEIEGEVVDANKIETALRSVGVALRDASGQFRDLDSVFLELSSKWDSLDTNTQRYIATIAAGSRQQSRFIAMMSNYSRTQELVNAANNAAGASNEQFQKTLDSLQSKLEQLSNAWKTFTQGLANNEFIKTVITLLTDLLNLLNKITNASDPMMNSIAKMAVVTIGLTTGDRALKAFRTSMQKNNGVLKSFGDGLAATVSPLTNLKKNIYSINQIKKIKALDSTALKPAISAMTKYNEATQALNTINANYTKGEFDREQATKAQTVVQAQQNQALQEYSATLGLTLAQGQAAIAIENLGVDTTQAAILASKGYNAAMLEEEASKAGVTVATYAKTKAEELSNGVTAKGLLVSLNKRLYLKLEAIGLGKTTLAQMAYKTSTDAATVSTWALLAPLLLVVAGIAALALAIWGIIEAYKALKANTPEAKLQAATEALNEARQAADDARESYEALNSAWETLGQEKEGLSDLVVGTREWRDQLFKVNEQVLDLIEKYPELQAWGGITTGDYGELIVDPDVMEKVMRHYSNRVAYMQAGAMGAEANKVDQTYSTIKSDTNNAVWSNLDYEGRLVWNDIQEQLYKAPMEGWSNIFENALKIVAINFPADQQEEFINKNLATLNEELQISVQKQNDYNKAIEQINSSFIASSTALLDTSQYSSDSLKRSANLSYESIKDVIEEEQNKIQSISDFEKASNYVAYWQGVYGVGNVDIKPGGSVVVTVNGEKKTIEEPEATAQYRYAQAAKTLSARQAALMRGLGNLKDDDLRKAANKAWEDKEGLQLTRADIDNLDLETLWSSKEIQAAFNGNRDLFDKEMSMRIKNAEQAYTQAEQKITELGLSELSIDPNVSAAATKGFANQLEHIVNNSGQEAALEIGKEVNTLLSHVAKEDRTEVLAQINAIDISDLTSIETLSDTFKQLGYNLPVTEVDNLEQALIKAGHATRKLKLDSFIESTQKLNNVLQTLRSGTHGSNFSKDEYELIINHNKDLTNKFIPMLDGTFNYIGGSIYHMGEDLYKKVTKELTDQGFIYEEQLEAANLLDRQSRNISDWQVWTDSQKRSFLTDFISQAKNNGIGLQGINQDLSWRTNAQEIPIAVVDSILESLQGLDITKLSEDLEKSISAYVNMALEQGVHYTTRTEVVSNAESNLTPYYEQYRAARTSIIGLAQQAGITDASLAQAEKWNAILMEMEDNGQANTQTYRNVTKVMKEFLYTISKQTAFKVMYEGLRSNVEEVNTLLEAYGNTENELYRIQLTSQMVDKFGIETTKDNYQQLAYLASEFSNGNKEAFQQLVNISAQVNYGINDAFAQIHGKTEEEIQQLGAEATDFVKLMSDMNFGRWDDETNRFYFAWEELLNITNKIGKNIDDWWSPYNWLWNANKEINTELRERNKLERDYNILLESRDNTYQKFTDNLTEQFNLLKQNTEEQQNIVESAQRELEVYLNSADVAAKGLRNYIAVGSNGRMVIDKEGFFSTNYNSTQGGVVDSEISKLESLVDTINSAQDAIRDNNDRLRELAKTGRSEYLSLIDQVTEALRTERQALIDKMSDINDAITDTQQKITDKLQEKIDDDRQARDDAKTRKNLEDQAANIAYLQASGADPLQVLKAQKELSEAQESYQDQLVDRSLQELQDANQKAADQRQEQIEIMQAQYDYWSENHAIHEAEGLVQEAVAGVKEGLDPLNTNIYELVFGTENVKAQSKEAIDDWNQKFLTDTNLASVYTTLTDETNGLGQIKATTKSAGEAIESKIDDNWSNYLGGNSELIYNKSLRTYDRTHGSSDADYQIKEWLADWEKGTKAPPVEVNTDNINANGLFRNSDMTGMFSEGRQLTGYQTTGDSWTTKHDINMGTHSNVVSHLVNFAGKDYVLTDNDYLFDLTDLEQVGNEFLIKEGSTGIGIQEILEELLKKNKGYGNAKFGNDFHVKYASGGLADFTGPAWLDGTKSAPEMVLNSTDTANLISLKDILSDILRSNTDRQSDTLTGNNYYDINVNVDSIDSDYDIDQAANRIRELIEEDAMYRNVNAVRQIR